MTKILMGIIAAMGLSAMLYYNLSVVPMKVKLEEQVKIIAAQDLRDQEQKATIEAIQNNLQKWLSINILCDGRKKCYMMRQ